MFDQFSSSSVQTFFLQMLELERLPKEFNNIILQVISLKSLHCDAARSNLCNFGRDNFYQNVKIIYDVLAHVVGNLL